MDIHTEAIKRHPRDEVGRHSLNELAENYVIQNGKSFSIETTLAGKQAIRQIEQAKTSVALFKRAVSSEENRLDFHGFSYISYISSYHLSSKLTLDISIELNELKSSEIQCNCPNLTKWVSLD